MRIQLDQEKCQGHSRCYALAPEVFDVDDEGFAVVLIDGELPRAGGEGRPRRRQLPRARHHRGGLTR
jgi:ferredoxin